MGGWPVQSLHRIPPCPIVPKLPLPAQASSSVRYRCLDAERSREVFQSLSSFNIPFTLGNRFSGSQRNLFPRLGEWLRGSARCCHIHRTDQTPKAFFKLDCFSMIQSVPCFPDPPCTSGTNASLGVADSCILTSISTYSGATLTLLQRQRRFRGIVWADY